MQVDTSQHAEFLAVLRQCEGTLLKVCFLFTDRRRDDFHLSIIMSNRQSPISDIFRFAKKGQTKPIIDTNMLNNDFFVFSQAEKRITIFHITN